MRLRFEYSKLTEGLNGRIGIIDTSIPRENDESIIATVDKEVSARLIVDKLNELQSVATEKPLNLHKDFQEYEELISKMDKDARRRVEIEEEYFNKSNEIIQKAINENFDFKAVYGGNTKDTRQKYADEQLSDLVTERQELKFSKEEDTRKLGYIKRLIDMKIQLIRYEVK